MSYTLADWDQDRDFDRWYTDATADWIQVGLSGHARVLEIGCASGRMTERLSGYSRDFVAVTLNPDALHVAEERGLKRVEWVLGDICDWAPRLHGLFTDVLCTLVLHESLDRAVLLDCAREQVEPGARLHVTVPSPDSLHRVGGSGSARAERFGVLWMEPLEAWEYLLESTGWRVVRSAERMLKPYANSGMEKVPAEILDYLAAYEGPGGTLYYLEAVAV